MRALGQGRNYLDTLLDENMWGTTLLGIGLGVLIYALADISMGYITEVVRRNKERKCTELLENITSEE